MGSASSPNIDTAVIVGATGLVGRRLMRSLPLSCETVLGTSRRGTAGSIALDLAAPPPTADWLPPAAHGIVVLAAAQTKADVCEADPVGTRRANVDGTLRVVEQAWDRGYLPIFLSSDYVFGGEAETYDESAATNPLNEYGRQKVEVERFLAASGRPHVIMRLGRVLTDEAGGGCILDEACRRLLGGTVYSAATDQWFSTVFVDDVARAIAAVVERRLQGLFHVAAHPTNRYDLIRQTAAALQVDPGLVQPCLLEATLAAAARPLRTVLSANRLRDEAAFLFTPPQIVIGRMAESHRRRMV